MNLVLSCLGGATAVPMWQARPNPAQSTSRHSRRGMILPVAPKPEFLPPNPEIVSRESLRQLTRRSGRRRS
jgi:hypothetical protein